MIALPAFAKIKSPDLPFDCHPIRQEVEMHFLGGDGNSAAFEATLFCCAMAKGPRGEFR